MNKKEDVKFVSWDAFKNPFHVDWSEAEWRHLQVSYPNSNLETVTF